MACEIKLKTGFFKTTTISMTVENKSIILSPISSLNNSDIVINEMDLIEIIIINTRGRKIQIEFYTSNKLYTASIVLNTDTNDIREIVHKLILNFDKKIIIEREE